MKELLYSALDIAKIVNYMNFDCKGECNLINLIWEYEKPFLNSKYRFNKRNFISDIRYSLLSLNNVDDECNTIIQRIENNCTYSNYPNLDLSFKRIRIQIIYGKYHHYVRIKLRTLLNQSGYKRRTQEIKERIKLCMFFYHLEATMRGEYNNIEICDFENCDLDTMVTFRVI